MHPLYPSIQPYSEYFLPVEKPHELYIQEIGNPDGLPVIILHSPGEGGNTDFIRFFDPECYRIIHFDQRGSGRSTPHIETRNNNTRTLLEDMESIRKYLKLKKWIVSASGLGAFFALLYATKYPKHTRALILSGTFTGKMKDINWYYEGGASRAFPDYWQEFISLVPKNNHPHIIDWYSESLKDNNEIARMAAAKQWNLWKNQTVSLKPLAEDITHETSSALAIATLELHYISNRFFIKENELFSQLHHIQHLPIRFIHGRYDMVFPLESCFMLHQALPSSQLFIVRDGAHSVYDPAMTDALINVTRNVGEELLRSL